MLSKSGGSKAQHRSGCPLSVAVNGKRLCSLPRNAKPANKPCAYGWSMVAPCLKVGLNGRTEGASISMDAWEAYDVKNSGKDSGSEQIAKPGLGI